MFFFILWFVCVILTCVIATRKKREIAGWIVFSLFFAPLALIFILILPSRNNQEEKRLSPGAGQLSIRAELEQIKKSFSLLSARIQNLENQIGIISPEELVKEDSGETKKEPAQAMESVQVSGKKSDVEIDLGRFWLNRIGIIVFALGVGFLITYTFKYFGALAKIIFGYLVSAGLFFFGVKLEKKERFKSYGRVLLGGAWAITYFTTYAMYHFDASKIIQSQLLDLLFLGVVAAGIIIHSIKYKSEELSAIALFIGYITATLGDVNYFTFLSSVLLAVATLVLVFKMQWTRIILAGIILTYLTHYSWVIKQIYFSLVPAGRLNISQVYFLINSAFLLVYWVLFTLGIHLINDDDDTLSKRLSAANFANFLMFFFLFYPKLFMQYPEQKFNFTFIFGIIYLFISWVMEKSGKDKLFISNIIIAVSLLTLSVPLRFAPFRTSLIWTIELPFLLFIGLFFDRKVFRYLSFALAIILLFKFLLFDFSLSEKMNIFGMEFSWNKFLSLLGFLSMSSCFYLGCYSKKIPIYNNLERSLYNIFSAFATVYFTIFIWLLVDLKWLTLGLTIEMLVLFIFGFLLLDKWLRFYSLLIFGIVAFRFCFIDYYYDDLFRWPILIFELANFYTVYFLYRKLKENKSQIESENKFKEIIFLISTVLFLYSIYRYILHPWTSLALGGAGVVLFVLGFLFKDKIFRLGGFAIFLITLLRIVFVDLSKLHIVYKIISFIILGVLFLAVSYIYTKINIEKSKS